MGMLLISKLSGLAVLFFLGYIFVRQNWLEKAGVSSLAWLVIDVTMPALFFCGVLKSGFTIENKGLIVALLGGFLVPCLGLLLSWPFIRLFPLENKQKGALWFDCCVGNSSFIPLPLCYAIWGTEGSLACLAYILGSNVFLFSIGIPILKGGENKKNDDIIMIFKHPQALAFMAGMFLFYLKMLPPTWLMEPMDQLGQATLPLAMLVTGAILAGEHFQLKEKAGSMVVLVGVKLLALPWLVFMLLKPFKNSHFGEIAAGVVLLEAAMPSLASAGAYARRFGGDSALAASGTLLTTLLCPLTIPLWMAWWG